MRIEMIDEHDCTDCCCSDAEFCIKCSREIDREELFCAFCQRKQTESDRESNLAEHLAEVARQAAPWAAEIIACEGGWMAFESSDEAAIWENQT